MTTLDKNSAMTVYNCTTFYYVDQYDLYHKIFTSTLSKTQNWSTMLAMALGNIGGTLTHCEVFVPGMAERLC